MKNGRWLRKSKWEIFMDKWKSKSNGRQLEGLLRNSQWLNIRGHLRDSKWFSAHPSKGHRCNNAPPRPKERHQNSESNTLPFNHENLRKRKMRNINHKKIDLKVSNKNRNII